MIHSTKYSKALYLHLREHHRLHNYKLTQKDSGCEYLIVHCNFAPQVAFLLERLFFKLTDMLIREIAEHFYSDLKHHSRIKFFFPLNNSAIDMTMGWKTLYITGKEDFRDEVSRKLEDSDIQFMPGYTGTSPSTEQVHDLYWVAENVTLKEFKQAVGSKLIWKYRLHFYASLEEFIESQNKEKSLPQQLSPEELALIAQARASVTH